MENREPNIKPRIYTVGTSHLDTSWNWTLETSISEYIPKTLHENFERFEKYPEYTFSFEGAYRYELMEEYYPEEFKKLKKYVADGRWNVTGSSYENGDVNVPSPESLFRNILYGNNYFEEKFGKRSKDIFLPDCFGFGYALPSIAHHANLIGFTTQKLTWSSAYGIPFDLGIWKGVDKNGIYASLNALSYVSVLKKVRDNTKIADKLKKNINEFGLPFTYAFHGVGDRGGAPKEASVATVCRELRENENSSVDVLSTSADQVFRDMDTMLTDEQKQRLPVWDNELVSTDHGVGGYTSRAVGKRWNRQNENLADCVERSAVAAMHLGAPYNKKKIDEAWKRVIAHQFHDDIPGTSLQSCYNRNWNDYMLSLNEFAEEYRANVGKVASLMDSSFAKGTPVVVNNPLQIVRRDAVEAEIPMDRSTAYVRVYDASGAEVPSQISSVSGGKAKVVFIAQVPALGYACYDIRPSDEPCTMGTGVRAEKKRLENDKYYVVLDDNGDVCEIYDKKLNRNILEKPIRMGLHQYYGSLIYPAWELRYQSVCKAPCEYAADPEFEIIENGPARVSIRISRTAGDSLFYQMISLSATGEAVEFQNEIDWRSGCRLLKTNFTVAAENPKAHYDLGLGVIERGNNTEKLYEVPAQAWADLTDKSGEFGVSVFSDCKYGWDKPDNHTLRLTGIHSPVSDFYPDGKKNPDSRQSLLEFGLNRYGFAVYSHEGGFENGTQLNAQRFCQPLRAFVIGHHKGVLGGSYSFGSLSDDGVILRAVKKAEQGDEIIVRVNEGINHRHENVTLSLGDGIASAREVYASEEPIGPAVCEDGKLVFSIDAYEPKTFALTLRDGAEKLPALREHPLALEYDVDTATWQMFRADGSIDAGRSLPAELFPEEMICGGVTFRFGSVQDGKPNAMRAYGQRIALPKRAKKLHLIACAVGGDQAVRLSFGEQSVPFTVHDLNEPVGMWDLFGLKQTGRIKDCVVAQVFTHMHEPQGDIVGKQTYWFKYSFDIPSGAQEVLLPKNEKVLIFAATATDNEPESRTVSQLHDRLEKRPFAFKRPLKDELRSSKMFSWMFKK